MLHHLFGYEAKRKRCLRKAPPGVLKEFLSIPFPDIGERVDAIPILAVDFETTGLSPGGGGSGPTRRSVSRQDSAAVFS